MLVAMPIVWIGAFDTFSFGWNLHTRFCSENGFLVEELDHFCPWTGTTIAKKNMCCFQTFLAMIMVTLIATLVMVGAASAHNVVRQCIVTVAFA